MESIRGEVIDSGGGEVRILVDRMTGSYPTIGSNVVLINEVPPSFIKLTNEIPEGYVVLMADNLPVGLMKLE